MSRIRRRRQDPSNRPLMQGMPHDLPWSCDVRRVAVDLSRPVSGPRRPHCSDATPLVRWSPAFLRRSALILAYSRYQFVSELLPQESPPVGHPNYIRSRESTQSGSRIFENLGPSLFVEHRHPFVIAPLGRESAPETAVTQSDAERNPSASRRAVRSPQTRGGTSGSDRARLSHHTCRRR
jgi:hypothetical protein